MTKRTPVPQRSPPHGQGQQQPAVDALEAQQIAQAIAMSKSSMQQQQRQHHHHHHQQQQQQQQLAASQSPPIGMGQISSHLGQVGAGTQASQPNPNFTV